jgi:4-amino-4-deoxy-L-arabinose transferase-like glycosyltransferase
VCSLGIIALLLAPTVWSVVTIQHAANGLVPVAGPEQSAESDPFILLLQGVVDYAQVDPKLVSYLEEHQGDAYYLVSTSASLAASPFIFQTGKPVLPLGGFNGNDHILTVGQLEELIDSGKVRYFWMSPFYLSAAQIEKLPTQLRTIMKELVELQSANPNNALLTWVSDHCAPLSESQWAGAGSNTDSSSDGAPQLYDCANHS